MRQKQFQKLLHKYKNGLCTPEEEAFVEKWYKAMGIVQDHTLTTSDKTEIKKKSWRKVEDYMLNPEIPETGLITKQRTFSLNAIPLWAIAASILLLMVSVVFLMTGPDRGSYDIPMLRAAEKEILNNSNEVMEVLLTDGSKVHLKPDSRITFAEPFDDSQRLVTLEGEAFFQVSRDSLRPFLVDTREVITKVLGTSFTVSAFLNEDNTIVAVQTGRVSVRPKKHNSALDGTQNETILTPNQKIIYIKDKNIVSRAIVEEPQPILPPAVVKRMHFDEAPVGEIFEGLEKVYGVEIVFDKNILSSCILTTSIAEGNIYNRLDMICKAIDARYFLKDNQIVIEGAGCSQK